MNAHNGRAAAPLPRSRRPMPESTDYEIEHATSLRFDSVKPGVAVPAVFWTTDAQLRVTSVQGSGLDALGIKFEDLFGAPLKEHLTATDSRDPVDRKSTRLNSSHL